MRSYGYSVTKKAVPDKATDEQGFAAFEKLLRTKFRMGVEEYAASLEPMPVKRRAPPQAEDGHERPALAAARVALARNAGDALAAPAAQAPAPKADPTVKGEREDDDDDVVILEDGEEEHKPQSDPAGGAPAPARAGRRAARPATRAV